MSAVNPCAHLRVKLYCDAANLESLLAMYTKPYISGFTTNPSLMRKAGVKSYDAFARKVVESIPDLPISFEVLADDLPTMEQEARHIAAWGSNVYVKVPVSNTQGVSTAPLVRRLSREGVRLNVTAVFTLQQVAEVIAALDPRCPAVVSVFAGRIADTGVDPVPLMRHAAAMVHTLPKAELLWASSRELMNVYHAQEADVDIITATPDILAKMNLYGKDLGEYSLDTVKMLYTDAVAAGFTLDIVPPMYRPSELDPMRRMPSA
jgi:transaldolase